MNNDITIPSEGATSPAVKPPSNEAAASAPVADVSMVATPAVTPDANTNEMKAQLTHTKPPISIDTPMNPQPTTTIGTGTNGSFITDLVSELITTSTKPRTTEVVYPPLNSVIQVLWELHNEDGTTESVWWDATVQASETRPGQGRIHFLLYVSHGEFNEEVVRVRFLPDNELCDLARESEPTGGVLQWRIPSAQSTNSPTDVVSLSDVMEDSDFPAVMDASMEALSSLPASKQIDIASRYRVLADRVKVELQKLQESKGKGYIVTEGDIEAIFRSLQ